MPSGNQDHLNVGEEVPGERAFVGFLIQVINLWARGSQKAFGSRRDAACAATCG